MMPRLTRRHLLAMTGAAALAAPALTAHAISSRPVSSIYWTSEAAQFGGFSAIELMPDRQHFLAISDQGYLARGRVIRTDEDRLVSAELLETLPLNGPDGEPLGPYSADAEGLSLEPDGSIMVSFEGGRRSRVARYAQPGGTARTLPRHRAWREMPPNSALEAVAVDGDGSVYTIPETAESRGFALYRQSGYRQSGGDWDVIGHLPRNGAFVPVGADFGPDGNLYVLERKFRLAFFATRISRLRPGDWNTPELLAETSYGVLDNHEGISITTDAQGRLWATTISDDNLNRFQRTEIAEFLLG